ncbi:MAG: hypothetical protein GXN99_00355 [Candidatus Nanohaloarchaeota archaeon]|nr:hypothetical protein [Candidatus Nanohaloarchaeota archaeon]
MEKKGLQWSEEAKHLLVKYGYCCISDNDENKAPPPIKLNAYAYADDFLLSELPNAYKGIVKLAHTYGLKIITEPVVHAYFFAVHNPDEVNKNLAYHQVHVVKIVGGSHPFYNVASIFDNKNFEISQVVDFYNRGGRDSFKPDQFIIIHVKFVVDVAPPYVVWLAKNGEIENLRAWESFIKRG